MPEFVFWSKKQIILPPAFLMLLRLPFIPLWHLSVGCLINFGSVARTRNHSRGFKLAVMAPPGVVRLMGECRSKEKYFTSRFIGEIFRTRLVGHVGSCVWLNRFFLFVFFGAAQVCFCLKEKVLFLFLLSAFVYFACCGKMSPQWLKVNAGGGICSSEARRPAEVRPSR